MDKNIFYAFFFALCASTGAGAMDAGARNAVGKLLQIAKEIAIEKNKYPRQEACTDPREEYQNKIDAKKHERRPGQSREKKRRYREDRNDWKAYRREQKELNASSSFSYSDSGSNDAVPYTPKRF